MECMSIFPRGVGVPGRRTLAALAIAGALMLVATSCKSSGYTYVGSQGEHVFVRVPSAWHQYSPREMLEATGLGGGNYKWMVGFDSDPTPSIDRILLSSETFPEYPVVMTFVRQLNFGERDNFALSAIRNAQFPIDQLANNGQGEYLNSEDATFPGGFHGERDKFRLDTGVGSRSSITVDQIGVTDQKTNMLWYIAAWCTSPCFEHQAGDIDRVLTSWTVEEH
jgi:hypothetical protein